MGRIKLLLGRLLLVDLLFREVSALHSWLLRELAHLDAGQSVPCTAAEGAAEADSPALGRVYLW
jgi:hypothetical protein